MRCTRKVATAPALTSRPAPSRVPEYHDRRAVAEIDNPCAEEPEDNGQGAVGHEEAGDVVRFHRRLPVSQRSPQYRAPSRGRISRARMYR